MGGIDIVAIAPYIQNGLHCGFCNGNGFEYDFEVCKPCKGTGFEPQQFVSLKDLDGLHVTEYMVAKINEKATKFMYEWVKENITPVAGRARDQQKELEQCHKTNQTLRDQVKQFESIPSLKELKEENEMLENLNDKFEKHVIDQGKLIGKQRKRFQKSQSQLQECKEALEEVLNDIDKYQGMFEVETFEKAKQTLSKL